MRHPARVESLRVGLSDGTIVSNSDPTALVFDQGDEVSFKMLPTPSNADVDTTKIAWIISQGDSYAKFIVDGQISDIPYLEAETCTIKLLELPSSYIDNFAIALVCRYDTSMSNVGVFQISAQSE